MDEKRRTGVEEGTYHNGHNSIRNDIDIEQAHADTQLRQDTANKDTQHHEQIVAPIIEDLQPERPKIGPETKHEAKHQHKLSRQDNALRLRSATLLLVHDLQGAQNIIGMIVDDLTPIDDALTGLHHATGDRHALQKRVLHLFRHIRIVGHILYQVIVDVARLQLRPIQRGRTIINNELISGTHGKQIADITRLRHRILSDIDALTFLFTQLIQILGSNDTISIQLMQTLLDILHVSTRYFTPQLLIIIVT